MDPKDECRMVVNHQKIQSNKYLVGLFQNNRCKNQLIFLNDQFLTK